MPTRYVDDSSEHVAQERFMSSPEYLERRGVLANAVAAKAQLSRSAADRSLLFFLQGLSMQDGGLRALAEDLFDMLPDRFEPGDSEATLEPTSLFAYARMVYARDRSTKLGWLAEFLELLCIHPEVDIEQLRAKKCSPDHPY